MDTHSKIYIAGHRGLVGSAICRSLEKKGYTNLVTRTHRELDLLDQQAVREFFASEGPEYVFLAAARVGGILANNRYRADFIYENLQIQNNIIQQAYLYGAKKLLFLGSSCIYPRDCPQPMKEDYLLTGELEYTNEPYAVAKIAGMKMCEAYNIQYGTNFISVMPTNLFGPGDRYDLERSHVLPAIIRKIYLGMCLETDNWRGIRADLDRDPLKGVDSSATRGDIMAILKRYGISMQKTGVTISLWGTGSPRREFMYSEDMADACVFLMEHIDFKDILELTKNPKEIRNTHINIGTGRELTIRELAGLVKEIVGFKGKIIWDTTKPDGTPRKLLDVSRLHQLGFKESVGLREGIEQVYRDRFEDLVAIDS